MTISQASFAVMSRTKPIETNTMLKSRIFRILTVSACAVGLCFQSISRSSSQEPAASDTPPVPYSLSKKDPLPDFLVKNKREGFYFTALPVIAYNPDTLFNYGALMEFYFNDDRSSPFFRYTPYRHKLFVTLQGSTGKFTRLQLRYDTYNFMDTPFRLIGLFIYERNPFTNYFGMGSDGMGPLQNPTSNMIYGSLDSYRESLNREAAGTTDRHYNEYLEQRFQFQPTAEYSLLGGLIRPLFGLNFAYNMVDDYSGKTVSTKDENGDSVNAVQNATKIYEDCQAGIITGCDGGWDNYFKIGISFDSRDFSPDPSDGVFFQFVTDLSTIALGSSDDYGRMTTQVSGYYNLLKKNRLPLVLAGRFLYNYQFWGTPFYSMRNLARTDFDETGLGGFPTLRGFALNRFVGPASMLANLDIRWSFADTEFFKQHLKFILVPFLDAGRAFDDAGSTTFADWRIAGGAGLRVAWNIATMIVFDWAYSSEGAALYMSMGHSF